jgi:Fe-S cluster assembly iron-binding protein IscA
MVEITSRAEELLLQLRGKHGVQTDGVRFETVAGKIRLAFASEAKPTDRVLEGARLPIYVAPELADSFQEAKIDAETTDGRQKIVVTRSRPAL